MISLINSPKSTLGPVSLRWSGLARNLPSVAALALTRTQREFLGLPSDAAPPAQNAPTTPIGKC